MFSRRAKVQIISITMIIVSFCLFPRPSFAKRNYYESIRELLNERSSVYLIDKDQRDLLAINKQAPLVPASIFKIVTATGAYHYLKDGYRFKTGFYFDDRKNLFVKGFGDPILISEELDVIASFFKEKGVKSVNSIYLDNSYFDEAIKIDGVERSLNPYDATNGALCVNFNTISALIKEDGSIASAEEQTPMTGFGRAMVKARLKKSGHKKGKAFNDRIVLSHEKDETLLYAGHLLKEFLKIEGIDVAGEIKKRSIKKEDEAKLFYMHESSKDLNDVVWSMMKYSNNFTANQVFLAIGASFYGPPATIKKSVDAISSLLKEDYGIFGADIAEGSGISRKNKISAEDFMKILYSYKNKHLDTLSDNGGALYKTGTLSDVKSAAGFLKGRNGDIYSFVIILNSERDVKKRGRILELIKGMIYGED